MSPVDNGIEERVGLFVLTKCTTWDIDVVVLHGLGGDPYSTWTAENNVMWPRDFIPSIIPSSRVMTFGYNSKLVLSSSAAHIEDCARDLLNRLRTKRWSSEAMHHPILFICHSLGGIVCKQALLIARNNPYYDNIMDKTTAIFFFGTPHRGSRVASWGTVIANFINTSTFHKPVQMCLLKDLGPSSEILMGISLAFKEIAYKFDIKTFYETSIMLPLSSPVVERDLAILGLPTEQTIPIAANHREMVRFTHIDSEKFDPVKYALREAKEGCPLNLKDLNDAVSYMGGELYVVHYSEQLSQISEHYENTCKWLTSDFYFSTWLSEAESDVLWLKGYPGVGKSVMTKFLITRSLSTPYVAVKQTPSMDNDYMAKRSSFLVYFFCSERNRQLQSEQNILRSILHQLLCAAPLQVIWSMQRFRIASGNYSFLQKSSDLWNALEEALIATQWATIFLVLDGLDEMLTDDLENFVKRLKTLVDSTVVRIKPRRLKLLLVSRPMTSIEHQILCPSVLLQSKQDVRDLIQGKMNDLSQRYELSRQLQQAIVKEISEKAKGMFLWALLAWHELCRDARCAKDFAANLDRTQQLPANLESLYKDILSRLNSSFQDLSFNVFAWLALASRPMHSAELRFMAAIGDTDGESKTARAEMITHEQLKSLCPELIQIDDKGYVQFVHSSIKDFFLISTTSSPYRIDATNMHSKFAIQCLKSLYLLTEEELWGFIRSLCRNGHQISNFTEKYFDIAYAVTNWHYHAAIAGEDRQVWAAFEKFLSCTEALRLWLMLTLYDGSEDARRGWTLNRKFWTKRLRVLPPPIHIAVFLQNHYFIRKVVETGASILALNEGWRNSDAKYRVPKLPVDGTVLHFEGLSAETLNLLLELGADMNASNRSGVSALKLAIAECNEQKVMMLLSHAKRLRGSRPGVGYDTGILNSAASMTMTTVIKEIMDDPLIDLSDPTFLVKDSSILGTYYTSPLGHACLHDLQSVAEIMMNHPRMIEAQQRLERRSPHRNPTSVAFLTALQGWEELTFLALKNFQVDVAAERDMQGRTIMIHAVMEEWHRVVDHCIDRLPRSKLNIQDANAMTALHHAAKERNWYAAKRLLEAGADSQAEDQRGMTPAHVAAEKGSERVLGIILEYEANRIESLDHMKRTVLHYAATWNLYWIVETIIRFTPNQVSAKDAHGRTPVHLAALFGATAVLSQLLSTGLVDINAKDYSGRTIFHLAVEGRVESCIQEMLSRSETDLNTMDNKLKSPLDMTDAINIPDQATRIRTMLKKAGCRPGQWRPRHCYAQHNSRSLATGDVDDGIDRSSWELVVRPRDPKPGISLST